MNYFFFLPLIFILFLTSACSPMKGAVNIASVATGSSVCPAFETFLHDQAQVAIEEEGDLPSLDLVAKSFSEALQKNYAYLNEESQKNLTDQFLFFYAFLFEETEDLSDNSEKIKLLTELEMGTHTNNTIQLEYDKRIQAYLQEAGLHFSNCIIPDDNPDITPPDEDLNNDANADSHKHQFGEGEYLQAIKEATDPAVFGALKTFATAYQSCDAISLEALGEGSPSMDGIAISGKHFNGVGNIRYIASLSRVQSTHPYIQSVIQGGTNKSCFNTYSKPLIYDYGGKPYSTSAASSPLNFFKDHGTGSDELGTDCSGFIYTALVTAGLKLAPNKPPRARGVLAHNARSFKDLGERMACFAKVKAGKDQTLIAGDILASGGHIFIVDWAGQDPLGVEEKTSDQECETITHQDFNFTLMQSSPSKGAIGMNRMIAGDYLENSGSMRKAMISFARTHCKQRLKGEVMTPQHSLASLIRHKKTPECMSEETVALTGESCLESCRF